MRRATAAVGLVAAALAAAAPALAEGALLRGPYLLRVTSTSVEVVWESPLLSTGSVSYGVDAIDEELRTALEPRTHQSVTLEPLEPSTDYRYRAVIDTATVLEGSFRTAPPPGGTAPFAFLVYGDNRSNAAQHTAVVDAMRAEPTPVDFLLNTGDLVNHGQDESLWDTFFGLEQELLAEKPIFVAVGNHEADDDDISVTQRIFELGDAFYQVVYGNAQLIVLNNDVDDLDDLGDGPQVTWLRDVLANPPAGVTHRFVFIHEGPYSSKPGRTGDFRVRRWLDQFDAAGVDVLFSGHDHYAERGFTARGLPYVIHGGGGAPLYDHLGMRVTADHTIVYGETALGYALVEVDGEAVSVTLRNLDGETVTSFSFGDASAPLCVVADDCGALPSYGCPGGAWRCRQSACEFICPDDGSLSIECAVDDDCALVLGATCEGEARCTPSGSQSYCACVDVRECFIAADCAGRPPAVAECAGSWSCDFDTCEFIPLWGLCDAELDAGEPPLPEPVVREAPREPTPSATAPTRPTTCACASATKGSPSHATVSSALLGLVVALSARGRARRTVTRS